MAKVQQKSEKISAFGGIFFVLDRFDRILSSVIDSHLGLRSRLIGYQSARLYGLQTSTDTSWHCRSWPSSLESRPPTGSRASCSDSSPYLPSGSERQGSTDSTSTPTSHTTLFGNTDRQTSFADASVYASRPYGVRGNWLMAGRITRLYR